MHRIDLVMMPLKNDIIIEMLMYLVKNYFCQWCDLWWRH